VFGHRTEVAYDGEEAYAKLEMGKFDAAILDIGMPRLNGYDLAHRIREQSWGRSMHLIALTGWGHAADRLRAQAAGFDRHLTKPVEAEHLVAALSARRMGAQEPSEAGA
jgi:CheY-like chemotaxis protein